MKFLVGNITVAVTGATTTQKVLADILHYVHTDTDSTDVEFEFMRQLPDWDESGYALTDDFLATPDRFRAVDKLWRYDGQMDGTPVKISVVARSQGAAKQFRHAIKETWRYFHIYGRGAYLHKARRFIFYVYLPLVQLMLLTKRSTFAHCSAIERDGKVVLFSALGVVGK